MGLNGFIRWADCHEPLFHTCFSVVDNDLHQVVGTLYNVK
jgi:hypothetical protein